MTTLGADSRAITTAYEIQTGIRALRAIRDTESCRLALVTGLRLFFRRATF